MKKQVAIFVFVSLLCQFTNIFSMKFYGSKEEYDKEVFVRTLVDKAKKRKIKSVLKNNGSLGQIAGICRDKTYEKSLEQLIKNLTTEDIEKFEELRKFIDYDQIHSILCSSEPVEEFSLVLRMAGLEKERDEKEIKSEKSAEACVVIIASVFTLFMIFNTAKFFGAF